MGDNAPCALLLVSKFGRSEADRYLTNDLADAFVRRGFRVTVVVIPWDAPPGGPRETYRTATGVEVLESAPVGASWLGRHGNLLVKWIGSSWLARARMRRYLGNRRFSVLYAMSPLVSQGFSLDWALRRCDGAYAHLVDFFPFHHRSLGVIPGGPVLVAAAAAENALARRFDVVSGMSLAGEAYLASRYRLRPSQMIAQLPLWGPQSTVDSVNQASVRATHRLPPDRPIAVFGGQIAEGRGIEDILQAAALARSRSSDVFFLLIGRGPLSAVVEQAIVEGADNVMLLDQIGRDSYLSLVAACDVGIVATVANVDVPTFPSKTIDYLRAGVPVAASVEGSTDFGAFVEARGFGKATTAGDPTRLLDTIETIVRNPAGRMAMVQAGRATLREVFNPESAVETVLDQLARSREGGKGDRTRDV